MAILFIIFGNQKPQNIVNFREYGAQARADHEKKRVIRSFYFKDRAFEHFFKLSLPMKSPSQMVAAVIKKAPTAIADRYSSVSGIFAWTLCRTNSLASRSQLSRRRRRSEHRANARKQPCLAYWRVIPFFHGQYSRSRLKRRNCRISGTAASYAELSSVIKLRPQWRQNIFLQINIEWDSSQSTVDSKRIYHDQWQLTIVVLRIIYRRSLRRQMLAEPKTPKMVNCHWSMEINRVLYLITVVLLFYLFPGFVVEILLRFSVRWIEPLQAVKKIVFGSFLPRSWCHSRHSPLSGLRVCWLSWWSRSAVCRF